MQVKRRYEDPCKRSTCPIVDCVRLRLYTSTRDLDRFVEAVMKIAAS